MVDTNNPGHQFILSGACVLMYGLFGMYLYPNTPSDHADQRYSDLKIQGIIIFGSGAVQLGFGCLTLVRDIAESRNMSFKAFLLWSTWIGLNLLRYLYIVYAFEMGWSLRFVVSVLSTLLWVFMVGKQFMKHGELTKACGNDKKKTE